MRVFWIVHGFQQDQVDFLCQLLYLGVARNLQQWCQAERVIIRCNGAIVLLAGSAYRPKRNSLVHDKFHFFHPALFNGLLLPLSIPQSLLRDRFSLLVAATCSRWTAKKPPFACQPNG
jgi:hypothetical protein